MASQPPTTRQSSSTHRPSSPSPPQSSALPRRTSHTQSTTSEDSQTVLLNNPLSESSCHETDQQQASTKVSPPPRTSTSNSGEPRKCWICFADETEDTPTSSAWRSPCPCALTAHEACLLDWVADLDAPKRKKRGGRKKIECPQCKAEISIARPRSYIVEGVNAIEAASSRLVVPVILVTLAGGIIAGCWMHGFSTVYLLFGTQDANDVLGLDTRGVISSDTGLSLPFIPVILVLSRTSIADSVLPVLPIIFLGSRISKWDADTLWPSSAAMTLAALPYIRGAYNELYKRLLAPRERAWMKEIQPRGGDHGEGPANDEVVQNENAGEGGLNFELGLEVEILEEHHAENLDPPPVPPPPGPAALPQGQPAPPQAANLNAPPVPAAPEPHQPNLILSTSRLADAIVGALIFPAIAASMGGILKLALPRTWTTPPLSFERRSGRLLQSRLGRSIVGGCLFVVLKDAAVLYTRFRMARDQKQRKVLDWGEGKGKGKESEKE